MLFVSYTVLDILTFSASNNVSSYIITNKHLLIKLAASNILRKRESVGKGERERETRRDKELRDTGGKIESKVLKLGINMK